MLVSELIQALSERKEWTLAGRSLPCPAQELSGMKFFVDGQKIYSSKILYLVQPEAVPDAQRVLAGQHTTVICWGDSGVLRSFAAQDCNFLAVDVGEDALPLFSFLESCFLNCLERQFKTEELIDLLLDGSGISRLVTAASELLGNPLWVTDVNYKYLAMNYVAQEPNRLIRYEYSSGYLADRSIDAIINNKMFERLSRSHSPVYFKIPGYPCGFLSRSIKVSGNVVAFLTMYEVNRPITPSDHASLLRMSKVLALAMQKSHFNATSNSCAFSSIMNDLLSGRFGADASEQISRRLRRLGYSLNPYILLMAVGPQDFHGYQVPPQFIVDRINAMLHNSICVYFQQTAAVLISFRTLGGPDPKELDELASYLADCGLIAGMSHIFQDIGEAPWHYSQAAKALELARGCRRDSCLARYEDYALMHMTQVCAQSLHVDRICHPALNLLRQYDRSKNTQLYDTLRIYLSFNGDVLRASQALFIHKNTLYHRLQQIRDVAGISLEDGGTTAYLWLSFTILDYLGAAGQPAEGALEENSGEG